MSHKILKDLRLVTVGSENAKVLRETASPVSNPDSQIKKIIKDMFQIMEAEGGVGLAAPQVGLSLRIIVIRVPEGEKKHIKAALINPQIIRHTEEISLLYERCLSVPGLEGMVPRFSQVEVAAQNEKGKKVKIKGEGLMAQVLQHEIDHLDGILYIDKAVQIGEMGSLAALNIKNAPSCNILDEEHRCEDGVGL